MKVKTNTYLFTLTEVLWNGHHSHIPSHKTQRYHSKAQGSPVSFPPVFILPHHRVTLTNNWWHPALPRAHHWVAVSNTKGRVHLLNYFKKHKRNVPAKASNQKLAHPHSQNYRPSAVSHKRDDKWHSHISFQKLFQYAHFSRSGEPSTGDSLPARSHHSSTEDKALLPKPACDAPPNMA